MKTLIAVVALSLATVFSAQAQTNKKMDKNMNSKAMKAQPQQDMMTQVKAQTDKMTRDLDLTADQSKEVMEQNKALYRDMSKMKMKDMKSDDMQAMKEKSVDKYDAAMKRILKDSQYKKYASMKDTYMMMMNKKSMPAEKSMDRMEK